MPVSTVNCVLPGAIIPTRAWSSPAQKLLQYIPTPNAGDGAFSTSAFAQTVRDDKGSFRVDGNSPLGLLSRGYGRIFLDSLPPAKRFGNLPELRVWWEGPSEPD